ncbi:MAG: hypothetical protein IJM32_06730 [Ruminococcus sp.]|nr:hypothetical protein [Ruminococcus sp.]
MKNLFSSSRIVTELQGKEVMLKLYAKDSRSINRLNQVHCAEGRLTVYPNLISVKDKTTGIVLSVSMNRLACGEADIYLQGQYVRICRISECPTIISIDAIEESVQPEKQNEKEYQQKTKSAA